MRRFEFSKGTSNKFWEIRRTGASFAIQWGRIGSEGQTQTKTFSSADKARQEEEKLIAEKIRKGYLEVKPKSTSAAHAKGGGHDVEWAADGRAPVERHADGRTGKFFAQFHPDRKVDLPEGDCTLQSTAESFFPLLSKLQRGELDTWTDDLHARMSRAGSVTKVRLAVEWVSTDQEWRVTKVLEGPLRDLGKRKRGARCVLKITKSRCEDDNGRPFRLVFLNDRDDTIPEAWVEAIIAYQARGESGTPLVEMTKWLRSKGHDIEVSELKIKGL